MKNQKVIFFTDCEFWKSLKFENFFTELLKKLGIKKIEFSSFKLPRNWEIKNAEVQYDYSKSVEVLRKTFKKVQKENPNALFIMDKIGSDEIIKEKLKLLRKSKNKDSFMLVFGGNPEKNFLTTEISKLKKYKPFEQEIIFKVSDDVLLDLISEYFRETTLRNNDLFDALEADPKYQERVRREREDFHRKHCVFSEKTLNKKITF